MTIQATRHSTCPPQTRNASVHCKPKTGARATPFKAQSHRRTLVPPEGSRNTPTPPGNRAGGLPSNSGGAAGAPPAGAAQGRSSGDGATAIKGVVASTGRKRPRDAAGGGSGDGDGVGMVATLQGSVAQGRLPRKHLEQRKGLPIFSFKADIIRAVKGHQVRPWYINAGHLLRQRWNMQDAWYR